jgi:hypothetical protein
MPTWEDILFRSGDVFLPKRVRVVLERYHYGSDTSLFYITNWSLIHVLSGILVGWILATYYPNKPFYWTGFWVHTAWEAWQILVKNTPYWTLRGRLDVVTDTLMFMGGMLFFSCLFTGKGNV